MTFSCPEESLTKWSPTKEYYLAIKKKCSADTCYSIDDARSAEACRPTPAPGGQLPVLQRPTRPHPSGVEGRPVGGRSSSPAALLARTHPGLGQQDGHTEVAPSTGRPRSELIFPRTAAVDPEEPGLGRTFLGALRYKRQRKKQAKTTRPVSRKTSKAAESHQWGVRGPANRSS